MRHYSINTRPQWLWPQYFYLLSFKCQYSHTHNLKWLHPDFHFFRELRKGTRTGAKNGHQTQHPIKHFTLFTLLSKQNYSMTFFVVGFQFTLFSQSTKDIREACNLFIWVTIQETTVLVCGGTHKSLVVVFSPRVTLSVTHMLMLSVSQNGSCHLPPVW